MAEPNSTAHPRPRAAENARRRREELLRAAKQEFDAKPYDEVSMSAIAKAANVSHGLAFHAFGSKQALYEAVMRATVENLNRRIFLTEDGAPRPDLRDTLDRFFTDAGKSEKAFRLGVRAGSGAEEGVRRIISEGQEEAARMVLRSFGVIRPNRLVVAAVRGWTGSLERTALAWLDNRRLRKADLVLLLEAELLAILHHCGYGPPA